MRCPSCRKMIMPWTALRILFATPCKHCGALLRVKDKEYPMFFPVILTGLALIALGYLRTQLSERFLLDKHLAFVLSLAFIFPVVIVVLWLFTEYEITAPKRD